MFDQTMARVLLRRSAFVFLFMLAAGCGDPAPPTPDLVVTDTWVRAAVVPEETTAPVNSAAYMTIQNRGSRPDRLVGASFEGAKRVELHESFVDEQGIASMRHVDSVELPPGGEARLEPGGLHVMLMGLDAPLSVGDSVSAVLQFEVSGRLTVSAVVRQL
jgi:copper(I)-binding protein